MIFDQEDVKALVIYLNQLSKDSLSRSFYNNIIKEGYCRALLDVGTFVNSLIESKSNMIEKSHEQ